MKLRKPYATEGGHVPILSLARKTSHADGGVAATLGCCPRTSLRWPLAVLDATIHCPWVADGEHPNRICQGDHEYRLVELIDSLVVAVYCREEDLAGSRAS